MEDEFLLPRRTEDDDDEAADDSVELLIAKVEAMKIGTESFIVVRWLL